MFRGDRRQLLIGKQFVDQLPCVLIEFTESRTVIDEQESAGGNVSPQGLFFRAREGRISEAGQIQKRVPALILVLGLTGWFGTSRLVRAEVQSVRGRDYITAARAAGVPPARLVWHHVLPNVAAPIIVSATLGVGYVILVEAGLSYLGIGVPQPTPSWGNIIREGQEFLFTAPWIAAAGGGAAVLTVLAFTVLGDGLQQHLDPRER